MLINILETIGLVALILVGIIIVAFLLVVAAAIISSGVKYVSKEVKKDDRKDD